MPSIIKELKRKINRAGETQDTRAAFEKMLRLHPFDNQGARLLLADLAEGKSRYQLQAEAYR